MVGVDGSAKDDRAGFGVWFASGSPLNIEARIRNEQNNAAAEILAIECALDVIPARTAQKILIVSDSLTTVEQFQKPEETSHAEKRATKYGHAQQRIIEAMRNKHEGRVEIKHIYSQLEEKMDNADEKKKAKIEANLRSWGALKEIAIRANEGADRLAATGREKSLAKAWIVPFDKDEPIALLHRGKYVEGKQTIRAKEERKMQRTKELHEAKSGQLHKRAHELEVDKKFS